MKFVRNSRYYLHPHTLGKLHELTYFLLGRSHTRQSFQGIFEDLLSKEERLMIAKRIAVLYLLMKGFDYVTICDVIKVSPGTVAKFAILLEKSGSIVPLLKTLVRKEETRIFIEQIFVNLFPPGMPGIDWKTAWERKNSLERKKQTGL